PLLGNSPTWGLLVPAIAAAVLLPPLAFALPDRQLETQPPRFTLRELAQSYWINPVGRPSFAALLVTAFCAIGAYAIPQIYLYYVLAFTIKVPESDLPGSVSLLAAIGAVAAIGAGALGGYLSDKLRRRKVFVIGSGLLLIAGTMVMMLARDFATLTVSQFMLAVAGGLLVTILLSVVAEVSNVETTARDAGMFSTVITLPNVIVPLIFGAVFVAAIPDFTVVFVTSLVLAAVACVLTFFIRDVP
ncbi:MAG TPA: MFS transporter, partial [Pseudolysinimonas sp.]|nr:MFS transporter [Pseudolysinimonas sp.]